LSLLSKEERLGKGKNRMVRKKQKHKRKESEESNKIKE
jgi:hypothetical protein